MERRKHRKHRFMKVLAFILTVIVMWKLIGNVGSWVRQWQSDEEYDVSAQNMSIHDAKEKAPQKLSTTQIKKRLHSLAKKDSAYINIYDNRDKYPTVLLRSLCNNAEMLEFVKGYLSEDGFAHGHLTKKECKEKIPLLLQWDQRWGYVSYGSSDIALSGCAPTCLSMVIVGLTGNHNATPNKIAKYAQDNGYYLKGTGTSWSLLTEGASHFGVVGREISLSKGTVCGVLKQGQPVICSVGRGDFTTEGHFIVLTGMKDGRMTSNKQTKEGNRQMAESILVVDDEQEIADLVEVYLQNEGYTVHKFYNAKDALNCLDKTTISLALLDVMLPDMDGFSLCRQIRQKFYFPIIMLTAKVEDMDKIMGLTVGADDYITKPFNPLELMARVKTQLRRYTRYNTAGVTQKQDEEIDIRGMHISNISHKCMLNGQEIALTPLEFDIVWYLARKRGKVVSSEELFEAVWKEKYLDNNNTVMAHIARIRDKMHETARKPKFIKTVWGVGYTIE